MSPRTFLPVSLTRPHGRCLTRAARRAPRAHPPLFVCVIGRFVLVFVAATGAAGEPAEIASARRARPIDGPTTARHRENAPEGELDFTGLDFSSDCIKLPRPGLRWQP